MTSLLVWMVAARHVHHHERGVESVVAPPASAWAKKEQPMPPGPGNPMGRVKLNFRPLYFLHGTPVPSSMGSAALHGCIRMHIADAIALARDVLAAGGVDTATVDDERVRALVRRVGRPDARRRPTR